MTPADWQQTDILIRHALSLHRQGQLDAAATLYRDIISRQPLHFDATQLLGMLHSERGQWRESLAFFQRAAQLQPDDVRPLIQAGIAWLQLAQPAQALACLEQALRRQPDELRALFNRALALDRLQRHAEALAGMAQVLQRLPDNAEAWKSHADILCHAGQATAALASYARALQLQPAYPEALNSQGIALAGLQRPAEALHSFTLALQYRPAYADALNNRGLLLAQAGQYEEALAHYRQALQQEPANIEACYNQGLAQVALRRPTEALHSFERTLALQPAHADALNHCANLLITLWRHAEAADAFARLLVLAPDYPYAAGKLFYCRLYGCDWRDYTAQRQHLRDGIAQGRHLVTPFAYLNAASSPVDEQRCAALYAQERYPPPAVALCSGPHRPHARIRVAYLSADFHEHATSYLMAELFELHDRSRFEITALSFGPPSTGAMRQRLMAAFDRFVDISHLDDEQAARYIHSLEIDIAVDLKGYTTDCRPGILAWRPAPVQVNYLGYPGTLGVVHIDYLLADRQVIPPADRHAYSEQVVYLPDSYLAGDRQRPIAARTFNRCDLQLPEQGFVFCCFNNSYKLTSVFFALWLRLLAQVPGSVLWLIASHEPAHARLRELARAGGIDPARLIFAPRLPLAEHLARHRQADLFLDTLPVNAHTTASDALWAGLPVLTCRGQTFSGRVGASLLHAAGLPELVTENLADYEALALELARSPDRLNALTTRLRQERDHCALFASPRFCRHLQAAYVQMWERSQQGLPAAAFSVTPCN